MRSAKLAALAATSAVVGWSPARAQDAPTEGPLNSGVDITQQFRRIDLRLEQNSVDEKDTTRFTVRFEDPVDLGGGWRANLRVDFPFASVDEDPTTGTIERKTGYADMVVQALFIHRTAHLRGFGVGAQLLIPTATDPVLGTGKWRLRPTISRRLPLPGVSDRSFFQLTVRHEFSFAGDDDRPKISQLQVAPTFEFGLPGNAYISLFPTPDFRYNFITDELFVPIEIEAGKSWKRTIVSLNVAAGVIKHDFVPYDWKVEGRIGFRF